MKNIKNWSKFNEGKISQIVVKGIMTILGNISILSKKIKGNYIPFRFKDKKLEKSMVNRTLVLFDYSIFDTIKFYISKSISKEMSKTSLSNYIKLRTNIDVYELADSILNDLIIDNIKFNTDEEYILSKLEDTIKAIKTMISSIKKVDDEIIDHRETMEEFRKLSSLMKGLDPRNINNLRRSKEDTLGEFDKVGKHLDSMLEPKKDIDELLDKISKFGMNSLTAQEKSDLEKHSK